MLRVVFTGPAVDGYGNSILRANLIDACLSTGEIDVQSSVRKDTHAVVASRTDTVKAKGAASRGLIVLTYPEFIARYLRGVKIPTNGAANPYTDKIDPDLLVPDFTGGKALADLDVL